MENKDDTKKVVKITEKQKAARMANLEKGRAKRKEMMNKKKETPKHEEYDLEDLYDGDGDDSSDDETFVISKQKPKQSKAKNNNENHPTREDILKNEVDELKNMVIQLATLQKKQNKKQKEITSRPKISVLLPNSNQPQESKKSNPHYDSVIANLQSRLGL